jgi:hypothetical protein
MPNQPSPADQPTYRILTIDGGGIVGTYPAAFLAGLEQHLDQPIGRYFDLIAGTSTGGIIAIGLAMGLSAKKVLNVYENNGPAIFGQHHGPVVNWALRHARTLRRLYRRKYGSEKLREALEDVLGSRRIGEACTRLLVPAWSPVLKKVYIYKTAHDERLRTDYKDRAVDAALATSAAPTYFCEHLTDNDVGLVDGGVWANNPIALAAVEAVTILGWPAHCLQILSLGCIQETYTVPKGAGITTLGGKAIRLFMDGQSHGAMGIAKLITGHEHRRQAIWRIDHTAPEGLYTLDDASKIQELKGIGFTQAREQFPLLKSTFFAAPAARFVPVYSLDAEAGQ